MKYGIAVALVALMSMPFAVLAEGEKKPMSDQQITKLQNRLSLTDEQVDEIHQIRDNGGTKKQIRAVLNDEQRAQLKELKKSRTEKNKESKAGDAQ